MVFFIKMMANTVIPIFNGGNEARKYYTINDGTDDKRTIYYDINYPVQLALKEIEHDEPGFGFRECVNCRAYGMQNNVALMPCWNCMTTFNLQNKYKCHKADATLNPCCSTCTWFSSTHGIYPDLTPDDFCLQTLHINELDNDENEVASILMNIRSMLSNRISFRTNQIDTTDSDDEDFHEQD